MDDAPFEIIIGQNSDCLNLWWENKEFAVMYGGSGSSTVKSASIHHKALNITIRGGQMSLVTDLVYGAGRNASKKIKEGFYQILFNHFQLHPEVFIKFLEYDRKKHILAKSIEVMEQLNPNVQWEHWEKYS